MIYFETGCILRRFFYICCNLKFIFMPNDLEIERISNSILDNYLKKLSYNESFEVLRKMANTLNSKKIDRIKYLESLIKESVNEIELLKDEIRRY